ncbi:hypothetical protein ABIA38_001677 [Embleya sp. AB8]
MRGVEVPAARRRVRVARELPMRGDYRELVAGLAEVAMR